MVNVHAQSRTPLDIRVKRAYDPPAAEDGARILVDRLWPRGVSRERLALSAWAKDVAPSAELRVWFGHRPERWEEFKARYRAELGRDAAALAPLVDAARSGPVTLIYAAKDQDHNGALVLRTYLEEHLRSKG